MKIINQMKSINPDVPAMAAPPWSGIFIDTRSIMDEVMVDEWSKRDPRPTGDMQERSLSLLSHSGIKKPKHRTFRLERHVKTQDAVNVESLVSQMRSLKVKKKPN